MPSHCWWQPAPLTGTPSSTWLNGYGHGPPGAVAPGPPAPAAAPAAPVAAALPALPAAPVPACKLCPPAVAVPAWPALPLARGAPAAPAIDGAAVPAALIVGALAPAVVGMPPAVGPFPSPGEVPAVPVARAPAMPTAPAGVCPESSWSSGLDMSASLQPTAARHMAPTPAKWRNRATRIETSAASMPLPLGPLANCLTFAGASRVLNKLSGSPTIVTSRQGDAGSHNAFHKPDAT